MKTIFKNGNVIDGTGSEGRIADVMVDEGRIVAIGQIDVGVNEQVIDATGKIICPVLLIPIRTLTCRPLLTPRCRQKFVRVLPPSC